MEAIVKISGRQYRLSEGQRVEVDRLATPVGESITFGDVLAVTGGSSAKIGVPHVAGASIEARVVAATRGPKIIVYKYKAKKRYRRTQGARADRSLLEIVSINGGDKQNKSKDA